MGGGGKCRIGIDARVPKTCYPSEKKTTMVQQARKEVVGQNGGQWCLHFAGREESDIDNTGKYGAAAAVRLCFHEINPGKTP